jgi:glycosyltransferase involved in cell wall biosynthesis
MDSKGDSMKKKILVKGPALSLSGYGEQARFALRTLREHQDKFDIFLQNIAWGKTGHSVEESEEQRWFNFLIMKTEQHKQQGGQFDISLQVTIPNEFEKIAPVNIGYTAGIETTKVAPHWIDKAKLMDKIIVVSNHSKNVYNSTEYKLQNNQTGQIIDFRNTTPIEVVHFPVKKLEKKEINLDLKTDFNFLSVAQWGPRKNVEATVVSFLKEFKNDSDVGLVLKLNMSKNCVADKIVCEKRIENIKKSVPGAKCKVYLLHGNMSEEEVQSLYTHPKIKAIVSTTHGEGFGLPLFEAVCNGLPVIAPKWSAHVEFLLAPVKEDGKEKMRNHFTPIDFDLGNVNKEAVWEGVIQPDAQWCFVKEYSTMESMRRVHKNHPAALSAAKKLREHVLKEFAEEKQTEKMFNVFKDYIIQENFWFDSQPDNIKVYE